jgi:hypothetical protein
MKPTIRHKPDPEQMVRDLLDWVENEDNDMRETGRAPNVNDWHKLHNRVMRLDAVISLHRYSEEADVASNRASAAQCRFPVCGHFRRPALGIGYDRNGAPRLTPSHPCGRRRLVSAGVKR